MVKYLSLLVFIIASLSSFSQNSNKVITFDFASPIYPSVFKIKPKQSVELVLKNINPYLYEVSSNDSLIIYNNNQPASFAQFFKMPELNTVPATAPPATPSVNGALPANGSPEKIAKDKENAIQKKLEDYIAAYSGKENIIKDILKYTTLPDELSKLLTDCYSNLVQLKTKADDYITNLLPALSPATLPLGIQVEINNNSSFARRNLEQYIVTGDALKKEFLAIIELSNFTSVTQYKSIEKDINNKVSVIDKILENSKKLIDKLNVFDEAKVGNSIEEAYNKVMTSRIEKRIIKLTKYNTDELLINIDVKKKKDVFCANEINSFPVNAIVTGGVKIDFSTGIVFNMGNHKFFDQKYHYDSVHRNGGGLTDSIKITRSNNKNLLLPSIGAFFHVYSRMLSHINIGGMVGASLGTDQRLYYNIGGSLLIGKSDRLVIGFGMSIAQATTLDGQYVEGQIFKRAQAPATISTEKAMRIGSYFSLSWNLNLIK